MGTFKINTGSRWVLVELKAIKRVKAVIGELILAGIIEVHILNIGGIYTGHSQQWGMGDPISTSYCK